MKVLTFRDVSKFAIVNPAIDSSTRGFYAILSKDLVAQERSLSFTYGRPVESCSSLEQMYFGKRRASRINLVWSR